MKTSLVYYILESLLFLSQLHLHSAEEFVPQTDCVFNCGWLGDLYPPFSNATTSASCGKFVINCTEDKPRVQFQKQGKWYPVIFISLSVKRLEIHDRDIQSLLESNQCEFLSNFTDQAYLLKNFTEQVDPFLSINFTERRRPFFKCKRVLGLPLKFFHQFQNYTSCKDSYDLYYHDNDERSLPPLPPHLSNRCSVVDLPSARNQDMNEKVKEDNLTSRWSATFTINWKILPACDLCSRNRGRCSSKANKDFYCLMKGTREYI